ncbi:baseplate wedge subunit [uncultured Caudovirales phage]|uniref:Baseplate wedge subunit n=1 Tax=uncultured Caudovirales phage TaxID=2100421 RepID=A0A6J5NM20_9CAUD|nr:baseplate wedge subunit [uncultured Caudovirales phage]CAB4158175.1 baseplate wedge subunit [uncultured Caudovirales phage]
MANNYIPQVDYTSRDYASIREDLIDLIPEYAPLWTNRDPADFGMTILETFSYMGDILNYYIDKSANEAFISTASQRENVLQLARLLGYKPTESTAATVTVTFSNTSGSSITVPALTQVATSTVSNASTNQIVFETVSAVTVPSGSTSTIVTATQGVTVNSELIGVSNGQVNQTFQLADSPVISGSVSLVVGSINYSEVQYLIDFNGYDPVFSTYTNASGTTFIVFGDNISGRVPPNNAEIYATYRVGGGAEGNVAANTIRYVLTNATSGLSVLNKFVSGSDDGSAKGGADPESTDSIRINAPLSVRSLNRAVSLSDYSALVVQVSGVAKAIAIADVYSSVTVFFAPYGDKGVQVDGVTPSTVFNTLKATVQEYLVDKIPANTTVTFQPPSYVPVLIDAAVTCLPQYKQSLVEADVNSIISELLAFDNVAFADRITLQDVLAAISSVQGVAYSQITRLVREDQNITKTVTNKALSSNVATITVGSGHGFSVGQTIKVADVDTTFNGTYVVTATASTTISYVCVAANVSSTAVTGAAAATALIVGDIICQTNEIPEINYETDVDLTLTGGILS